MGADGGGLFAGTLPLARHTVACCLVDDWDSRRGDDGRLWSFVGTEQMAVISAHLIDFGRRLTWEMLREDLGC